MLQLCVTWQVVVAVCKRIWSFLEESGGGQVWVGERGWRSRVRAGPHGMGFWKFSSKEWHHFSSHIRLILGDGSRISFWGEVWCRSLPLREVFLGLYSLASNKEASIADNHELMIESHQWNASFLHSLNDWEVEDLASFYSLLYSYMLGGRADKIWWVPSRKKKFEVRSFYNIFISNVRLPFPWNSIWRTKALPRVAFFVWSIALGKILTLDSLRKKNMVLVNRCGMCKKDVESIDHLFLHCECAQFLWNAFFNRFGLAWVMPCGVVNLFAVLVVGGSLPKCRGLENGSALYHVVSMVQTKLGIF
jgi:hypothetical protein